MSSFPFPRPLSDASDQVDSFMAALEALANTPAGPAADRAALELLDQFILGRPAGDPGKATRFSALCQSPRLNPNLAIPLFDHDPLSGLAPPTERPFEFAISQFLASAASPAWAQCVENVARSARLSPALNRPLMFFKLGVESADEMDDNPDPSFHFIFFPSYASGYLRFEASGHAPHVAAACVRLAASLERLMSPSARSAAAMESFTVASLGSMAHVVERSLSSPASAPIETPAPDDSENSLGLGEGFPDLLRQLSPRRRP